MIMSTRKTCSVGKCNDGLKEEYASHKKLFRIFGALMIAVGAIFIISLIPTITGSIGGLIVGDSLIIAGEWVGGVAGLFLVIAGIIAVIANS